MNSLGVVPLEYLDVSAEGKVAQLHANAREILAQYKRKWTLKRSSSLWFQPPQHTLPVEEVCSQTVPSALLRVPVRILISLSVCLSVCVCSPFVFSSSSPCSFLNVSVRLCSGKHTQC
jgi:hypothetical protein